MIITCDPDNIPSRRTCEALGAELLAIVDVPEDSIDYAMGHLQKCQYRIELAPPDPQQEEET